jgi:hypothetical protein
MFAAPAICGASTIDVSSATSVVVNTGDTLVFQLSTSNFAANAARFGLQVQVTDVDFALATLPLSGAGKFVATLESADQSTSVAFGDLTFGPGYFQGSGYVGEVSTLQGYMHISPLLSEALFGGSSILIALQNEGPDVTIGLAPYLLRQDLYTSLSGGPLSVGAIPGSVELESPASGAKSMNLGSALDFSNDDDAPEPNTGVMLLGGGTLLCGLSAILTRLSRRRT